MNEYETIIEGMRFGVSKHMMDRHFTVLWANKYAYELTGNTRDGFRSRYHNRVDEYYSEDSGTFAYVTKRIEDAYRNRKECYSFECPMRPNRGKVAWIRMNGRFTGEVYQGSPVMWNVFYDITDSHREQEELKVKSELLDSEIEKAEQMIQWTTGFLAELNSEIRTMANIIVGMADVAEACIDDPAKCEECLEKIVQATRRLRTKVGNARRMFRPEAG